MTAAAVTSRSASPTATAIALTVGWLEAVPDDAENEHNIIFFELLDELILPGDPVMIGDTIISLCAMLGSIANHYADGNPLQLLSGMALELASAEHEG